MRFSANESDFDRKLRTYDDKLLLLWSNVSMRWEVWRFGIQRHLILRIETPTGGYRAPVEAVDMKSIYDMDTWRHGVSAKDLTTSIDSSNNKREQKKLDEIHDRNKYYAPLVKKALQDT